MATLTVGAGKQYGAIASALLAAKDGDTVAVSAGVYANDFGTVKSKISLVAVGGQVTLLATQPLPSGKGLLTVGADATIDGFVFAGAQATDGTGAGLLYTGGALVVRNSLFTGNQNGLLALANAAGKITIQSSEFSRNGNDDGFSHNVSVGAIKSLTIQDSYIHNALGGSEVRSRAQATTVTGSRIADNASNAGIGLDLPNAGAVLIQDSVIEKGAQSQSASVIRFGGEAAYAGSSLKLNGSTVVSDLAGAVLLQNQTSVIASVAGNQLYGFTGGGKVANGPIAASGNLIPANRPAISTAPLIVPATALPVEYGRAGAVIANGAVLSVGAGGQYASLAAALAVAQDGDTIQVAAGRYAGDGVTISRKVIIEGVGGLAQFKPGDAPSNGLALFVTTTDVTFRNIEIAGVATPAGASAAIRSQAGNLTLVNSFIHDNQAGIVAGKDVSGSIGIYDSEIARNGTPDGRGANIDVAEIGTLTLRNDWVHDGSVGAEVISRADNTVIDGTRISQAAGNGASGIELPNAGRVTITGGAIEKGEFSQQAALVHIGGESVYAGSAASISGTVLINDLASPKQFVAAETGAGAVTVSGATFVGSVKGSTLVQNGTNTGAIKKGGMSIGATAPWGRSGAPAASASTAPTPAAAAPDHGVLVLRLSGNAYQGNAKFTITLDGAQIGDTLSATAVHATGETQTFTMAGAFVAGPHSIAVQFVNDLQGTAPGEDRNLYVDGLSFNGEEIAQSATLTANGTALLSTGPVSRLTPIAVNLSEDAWKGDAQAFIAIDGKVTGGVLGVTASHAVGKTQAMQFLLDLAPGPHTASVTFLNAAGDADAARRLYIDSIDVAGQHYAQAAALLPENGTSTFAFTVAPPQAANAVFLTAGLPQPLLNFLPSY